METLESIRASGSRGKGVLNRPLRCLPSHPHPLNPKEVPTDHPQILNLPIHLSSLREGYGFTSLHGDGKGSEVYGPLKGSQTKSGTCTISLSELNHKKIHN